MANAGRPIVVPIKRKYNQRPRKPKKAWDPYRLVTDKEFLVNMYMICLYSRTKTGKINI